MLVDGRMIPAAKYGKKKQDLQAIRLTDDEKEMLIALKSIWEGILNISVQQNTDFFATGAGSMDVVRYIMKLYFSLYLCICDIHITS
jgi:formyltetrahydrofolate dehydrogenase